MRTFADWNDPAPGSMEMDLVAHCGPVNRGSYVNSLVLTDIATGWTEAAPIEVREGSLVVETLDRIRAALPFALQALDVDYGTEFVNDRLIEYCLGRGIELTRSRPYRKNDQAWIEQKNGAIVRKLLGYRRFEGLAAARAITRLYGAARLFVNFFQPSFKLASKHRDGAKVTKRYHPPLTPCDRILQTEGVPMATKDKLREVSAQLDPPKLLEEMSAVQAYLAALADGEAPPTMTTEPPNLATFVASLSSAWRDGAVRPTFSIDAKPRYLRGLQAIAAPTEPQSPSLRVPASKTEIAVAKMPARLQSKPQLVYAAPGNARIQALRMGAAHSSVIRIVEGLQGSIKMRMHLVLRFDYGSSKPWVTPLANKLGFAAISGPHCTAFDSDVSLDVVNETVEATFDVCEGQRLTFALTWGLPICHRLKSLTRTRYLRRPKSFGGSGQRGAPINESGGLKSCARS